VNSGPNLDPAWLREIDASLGVSSHFVLGGNVKDLVIGRGDDGSAELPEHLVAALWRRLRRRGYEFLLVYDLSDGLRVHPAEATVDARVRELFGTELDADSVTREGLVKVMQRLAEARTVTAGMVIERAGRLVLRADRPDATEQRFFADAAWVATNCNPHPVPRKDGPSILFDPVIWVVENERELPDWFLDLGERLRSTSIPYPEIDDRRQMARWLAPHFADHAELDENEREVLVGRFVGQTQGMTLADMQSIMLLANDLGTGLREIEDAARGYRVGVLENPWKQASLREKVKDELVALDQPVLERDEATITRRVMGQDEAVRRSLDILARSVTNLTAAHRSAHATGPRGVLFFAGPTGVGKTELAKALTELVFGDSAAYTRFDMSEFAEESAAARLIGAPPGYVGFDAGGELTNAIRERAFSLVLFDEIEKAHDLILDKFLQILEDGRLTDGRGATVAFTEAILVFTSNLGVYSRRENGERKQLIKPPPEMDHDVAERKVLGEIERFFVADLGRPELLNRIGNNVVVFEFIGREAGDQILTLLLRNVERRIEREYGTRLVLAPETRAALAEIALADLSNGGRGIGSAVEQALVNPLARHLIAATGPSETLRVTGVRPARAVYELDIE
jgi:hypothetical protein